MRFSACLEKNSLLIGTLVGKLPKTTKSSKAKSLFGIELQICMQSVIYLRQKLEALIDFPRLSIPYVDNAASEICSPFKRPSAS